MYCMYRWILLCDDRSDSSNRYMCRRVIFFSVSHSVLVLSYWHICGICINVQLHILFRWNLLSYHRDHRMH